MKESILVGRSNAHGLTVRGIEMDELGAECECMFREFIRIQFGELWSWNFSMPGTDREYKRDVGGWGVRGVDDMKRCLTIRTDDPGEQNFALVIRQDRTFYFPGYMRADDARARPMYYTNYGVDREWVWGMPPSVLVPFVVVG